VVVSTQIIKTLDELEWIRIVGYKEVPGKPGLYATTKTFLDHFGLKSLEELPPLAALEDFANFAPSPEAIEAVERMEAVETIETTETTEV
jgi:segregation and condensation protein B